MSFKRRTSAVERDNLKQMLGEFTPMHLHTKKLAAADEEKLIMGNSNQVPTLGVLQKISSQKNLENRMEVHPLLDCLKIQESQDLNQKFTPLKHQYIQFVAGSPFATHMYTVKQLQLLKDLQKDEKLLLYLDATGSVVAKQNGYKRILYYALCCPVQSTTSGTTVAAAEMLSSDQSTPTIQHWLNCLNRDFTYMFKQSLQPQKIETDFSWAIIHATLQTFCQTNVHRYLQQCIEVCMEGKPCTFTVVHICAAHMLKLLCNKIAKAKCPRETRALFLHSFALIQNASKLADIQSLLQDICTVFSERNGLFTLDSLQALQTKIHDLPVIAAVDEEFEEKTLKEILTESTPKTIIHGSPFTKLLEKTLETQNTQVSGAVCSQVNPYYCPRLIEILKSYLATVPLWTGIMLHHLGKTRDTNTQAENWFRTTKVITLKNKLHRRPGDFIQIMYEFICGRIRGVSISSIRQSKVNQKDTDDSQIDLSLSQEEKWRKRREKKKKSKYYNPPKQMQSMESIYTSPPWCGRGQIAKKTISLRNTCTIDNLLYFLFLAMKKAPFLLSEIQNKQTFDRCFRLLLMVYNHFVMRQWSLGRISWLDQTSDQFKGKQLWDTFGTEQEFVVCHLKYTLQTTRQFVCNGHNCPNPAKEYKYDTVAVLCNDLSQLQESFDKWSFTEHYFNCTERRLGCVCHGRRAYTRRIFTNGMPAFIAVSIDSVVSSNGHPEMLPAAIQPAVIINSTRYKPVAITYHLSEKNHFIGFHRLSGDHWNLYDGMKERKQPGSGDQSATAEIMNSMFTSECTIGHILLLRTEVEQGEADKKTSHNDLDDTIIMISSDEEYGDGCIKTSADEEDDAVIIVHTLKLTSIIVF
ncbi:hypothetical protein IRJ41_021519 [Triplophysa rosa]|uniref:Uncharacterized protein n=1 Tax=Triplophysa rosa TaxID=992332 RepID=A0A9W7WJD5_TRIRA|nr:hypothetical protein IRJ41_021519 [Triplophysa rosa]